MKKGKERKKATKTDNGLLYSCVMDIVELLPHMESGSTEFYRK